MRARLRPSGKLRGASVMATRRVVRPNASRHLTRAAVLDLPAFAVFGPESTPRAWPPERNEQLSQILLELIGDEPEAWNRIAVQEVENRGPRAWLQVRELLNEAGVLSTAPPLPKRR